MDSVNEDNGVVTVDVNGGQDIWSSKTEAVPDHLVVMVNGILGSVTDWKFAADQFVRMLPDKVVVHCSKRNVAKLTLDGVDVMGERLAEEVVEVINQNPKVKKISFVAHSVGGLVARYAIGRLYRPPKREAQEDAPSLVCDVDSRGTIAGLDAMNFITVATPHLGSRGNKQVPFLFGVPAIEKLASCVIHLIFRKTGQHLFLNDSERESPLLQRMVADSEELYFMSALCAFRRRVTYSNVCYDHIVGWRTSSIRRNCELPKLEATSNERYPHIVHEESSEGSCTKNFEPISVEGDTSEMLEEVLLTRLTQLPWERVGVSFHSSRLRYSAHSVIQVKDSFMQSEGSDVILHMIDHFLT